MELRRVGGEEVAVDEGVPDLRNFGEEGGGWEGAKTGELVTSSVAVDGAGQIFEGCGVVGQGFNLRADGGAGFEDGGTIELVVSAVVREEVVGD